MLSTVKALEAVDEAFLEAGVKAAAEPAKRAMRAVANFIVKVFLFDDSEFAKNCEDRMWLTKHD
jgi:hypothetical protein